MEGGDISGTIKRLREEHNLRNLEEVKNYLNSKKFEQFPANEEEAKQIALEWKVRDYLNQGMLKEESFDIQTDEEKLDQARYELGKAFEEIDKEVFDYYMDLSRDEQFLIILWIVGTYFHKHFPTFPILFLWAMKGSGKSRLLSLISWLVCNGNGKVLNNASEAVVFRTAQERPLIFDEFESIGNKERQTMREILNSTYKRGGLVQRMKKVHTQKGEEQIVESFSLYTPVCIANISGLEEVLEDRSIVLVLEKSDSKLITKKLENFENNTHIHNFKEVLGRFSDTCVVTLAKKNYIEAWNQYIHEKYGTKTLVDNVVVESVVSLESCDFELLNLFNKIDDLDINGRNLEIFFPLIIIANFFGEEYLNKILKIARKEVDRKKG